MSLVHLRKQLFFITDYDCFLNSIELVKKIVDINDERRIHLRSSWFLHLHKAMCVNYNTLIYKNTRYLR